MAKVDARLNAFDEQLKAAFLNLSALALVELGALRAAELPPPRKPPKSAAKIPGGARKRKR